MVNQEVSIDDNWQLLISVIIKLLTVFISSTFEVAAPFRHIKFHVN